MHYKECSPENTARILVEQQIVVPSLSKKATWNKFLLLPRLILSNPAGIFFFIIIHSSFQLNQRGFWPLLQCCKLASFKNLAVAKNDAQNLSTFQMKLKWTSTLSVPSMKTLILIVKNSML